MNELFIELGVEEIPARLQTHGAEQFMRLIAEGLKAEGISFSSHDFFASPRHMAVVFRDVPVVRESRTEEKRGPRIDAPQAAIDGFLASNNITREQCEERETPKGTFLFAAITTPGTRVSDTLPRIIEDAVFGVAWPNSMRWGWGSKSWIRPIRSGICLFGGDVISFRLAFGDHPRAPEISFGNTTKGHRFLSPGSFAVHDSRDYIEKLERSHVIADHRKRRQMIVDQVHKIADDLDLTLVEDAGLTDEVTGLVEWPVALAGRINPDFMSLPPEVLMTSMRVHQRYFSLKDCNGNLAPWFITISNMEARDQGKQIIKGNERVLNARLSDARFFFDQDVRIPLAVMADDLSRITFHASLGTMAQKTGRLQELAVYMAEKLNGNKDTARKAASLLKADLTSKMVGEFPELQGIMGEAYAHAQGHGEEIAKAISAHYMPSHASGVCPDFLTGQICALADRIDTLAGFFAIGIRPTGSKDPFALRRSAIGLIRLLEEEHDLDLKDAFSYALELYKPILDPAKKTPDQKAFLGDLEEFLLDRLKVLWREQGLRHDIIAAAFSSGIHAPLYLLKKRAHALQAFLESQDSIGNDLLRAYRRASNIVHIEETRDNCSYGPCPDRELVKEKAELELLASFEEAREPLDRAMEQHDFRTAMNILASLRPGIDTYFQDIIVNSPDPAIRQNRLKTLSLLRETMNQVADFSRIVES